MAGFPGSSANIEPYSKKVWIEGTHPTNEGFMAIRDGETDPPLAKVPCPQRGKELAFGPVVITVESERQEIEAALKLAVCTSCGIALKKPNIRILPFDATAAGTPDSII